MEELLAKASQLAQQAETLRFKEEGIDIKYEDRELKKIQTKNTTGVSLRVIKDDRLGMTCGTLPLDRDEMIDQVLISAQYGDKVAFSFPDKTPLNAVKTHDKKVAQLSIEEMCQTGESLLKKMHQLAPSLIPDLTISKEILHITIANSLGLKAAYEKTVYGVTLSLKIKGSKTSVVKGNASGKYFLFPDQKMEDLIKEYRLCDTKCSVPTKKMSVIFTASAVWSLLYRVYAAINGDSVYRGISPLNEKTGTKIFDAQLNILDDPLMDYGVQSCPFDDEGVSTYKKYIIEQGVLRSFIFDLSTAAKYKTKSTGNGYKRGLWGGGIEMLPGPSVANFIIAPGKMPLSEMIKDINEGIVVDEVVGFHSGNIIQGEFSMNVGVGYWIEQGKPKGRAMDAMVAGNIYESFNQIHALGDKIELGFLGYGPAIYFREMSVAGKL